MAEWLTKRKYDYMVTFNFNTDGMSERAVKKEIVEWHKRLDRQLLGRRYYKKRKRTKFAAFVEHFDSNIHVHAMLQWGDDTRLGRVRYRLWAEKFWKGLVVGGSIHIQKIRPGTKRRVAGYVTKDFDTLRGQGAQFFSNDNVGGN